MKSTKSIFFAIVLFGSFVSSNALAGGHRHGGWHGGSQVGVYLGGPVVWPYYSVPYPYYSYGYPYYSPPVVTFEPSPPVVYIEKEPEKAYWYFCSNPNGYYPYVKQCPAGWQKVVPQPPNN